MENLAKTIANQPSSQTTESSSGVVGFAYHNNVWIISEEISDETLTINFDEKFDNESAWQIPVAKASIYSRCIEFEGSLRGQTKLNTERGHVNSLVTMFSNCKRYNGDKILSDYSEYDLLKIICHNRDSNQMSGYSTVKKNKQIIEGLFDLRLSQHLTENEYLPSLKISENWLDLLKDNIAPEGFNLTDWIQGGSWDMVPFEVSLAVLTYCIEIIKSDEMKYVLAWYEMIRNRVESGDLFHWQVADRVIENFGGEYTPMTKLAQSVDLEYLDYLKKYFPNVDTHADLPLKGIPFTFKRINNDYPHNHLIPLTKHFRNACYVAFLILTGVRDSEASEMKFDAIKKDGNQLLHYTPLHKTNYGIETGRPILFINRIQWR